MPLSTGEETLALHLDCYKIKYEREFRFDPDRRWRFDFCVPEANLGIEVEGGSWQIGRHQRGKGFADDIAKYNTATLQGWHVLRFTTDMVISGAAIDTIRQFLDSRSVAV